MKENKKSKDVPKEKVDPNLFQCPVGAVNGICISGPDKQCGDNDSKLV